MWLWLRKTGKIYHPQSQKNCYWSRQVYDLSLCVCVLSCFSHLTFCDSLDCLLSGSSVYGDFPGKDTGVGCHVPLQGIFPTHGLNPGLLHCRWIFTIWATREAQEYWSGQPIPSPGNLPNSGIKPESSALQTDSLPSEPPYYSKN